MPQLIITPDELKDMLDRKVKLPSFVKKITVNSNTLRVGLSVEKIPVPINLNLQFDSFSQGLVKFNYSGSIPQLFIGMLKSIVFEKSREVVSIDKSIITVNIKQALANNRLDAEVKKITFENGYYKVLFQLT